MNFCVANRRLFNGVNEVLKKNNNKIKNNFRMKLTVHTDDRTGVS